MIERLLYQSTASYNLGTLQLFNLLTQAQQHNERLQLTGHLLYFRQQFTQCIEGPTVHVEALWQRIQKDPRHHDVELLQRRPIEARRFSEWSMAFSTYSSLYVHGLRGFFPVTPEGRTPLVDLCMADLISA